MTRFTLPATKGLAAICMAAALAFGAPASAQHNDAAPTISAEFPFEYQYADVNGNRMAYVEDGTGPVVLFIHGNPTSSYLWRNIIPFVSDTHRAVAVDLIGMGASDKPDIGYTFQDHYAHLEGFIDQLGLTNITLVLHAGAGCLEAITQPITPTTSAQWR